MTHDLNEPSYYEVALTNRQVLMAFIVILSAVLGSFLCGVWVGKGGTDSLHAQEMAGPDGAAQASEEGDDLESFRFFTDEEKGEERVKKPDLSRLMDEPDKETTLAEDVGSQRGRNPRRAEERQRPAAGAGSTPPKEAAPPPPAPPPPAAASPPPPPVSPPAAKPAAEEQGEFIVQVFSTHDEAQARKVRSQVEGEGYTAFISPVDQPEGKFYRVRIGPFAEKARAERAARGIKKKFKLETWVTAASN